MIDAAPRRLVEALLSAMPTPAYGARVIGWGGALPVFAQVVPTGAVQVRHCSLHVHQLFDMAEWSEALLRQWATERLTTCPLQAVWTRAQCARVAAGFPIGDVA